jgi:deoxyribodipyrimidine photo-lyase
VLPVFILDDETPGAWKPGGAARWWLHHSLASLTTDLAARGGTLVLRRGRIEEELPRLVVETGAAEIHAGMPTEPWARRVIERLRRTLPVPLHLHRTATMFTAEEVTTQAGKPFAVFTPFSHACRSLWRPAPLTPAPERVPAAAAPMSDRLDDFCPLPRHPDWAGGLRANWTPGETGARHRLNTFVGDALGDYAHARDLPGRPGTSMLSPHFAFGELSPDAAWEAAPGTGDEGAFAWQNELLWREFSAHLLWHHPDLPDAPLRPEFAKMPWRDDPAALHAWQRGETGVPIVDAGMRQLWQTGWMHNRLRMIVASFLVKHLLLPWQLGEHWFWDTLVDADLASNSAQWQWVAGCGADAAPYFRVFNPVLQGRKFDADGNYVRRWVPELAKLPAADLHAPWEAPDLVLQGAGVALGKNYPRPIVDLAEGRQRALRALETVTAARA